MITGIGHVEESGLQAVLERRGSYAITETEFLQMMNLACSNIDAHKGHNDGLIVTGLDPTKVVDHAFDTMKQDTRLSHIGHALKTIRPSGSNSVVDASKDSPLGRLRLLLSTAGADGSEIKSALELAVLTKLSELVGMDVEQVRESLQRPLSELGLDSIVAVDLQSWTMKEFKVAIDLMDVIAGRRTIKSFLELIEAGLVSAV